MGTDGQQIRAFDLFCGAGGSSCGAQAAGATIVGGIDAWPLAIDTFSLNYPDASTWVKRIEHLTAKTVAERVGKIDLLLASPECTNHTFAKGRRRNGKLPERSRNTANYVVRFAKALKPRWIVVENVVSMRRWKSYPKWLQRLKKLKYNVKELVLDAHDFAVPQSRRRLFVICDNKQEPTTPDMVSSPRVPARAILHSQSSNGFSYAMTSVFEKLPKRAARTLQRARSAIATLGDQAAFLLVYYGSDRAGGWQGLDRPLRTITTLDRFALVKPSKQGHVMRMLQPPELAKAMGFPQTYKWPEVNRRERIRLIGNAVAPPVMKAIVQSLTAESCHTAHSQNGSAFRNARNGKRKIRSSQTNRTQA